MKIKTLLLSLGVFLNGSLAFGADQENLLPTDKLNIASQRLQEIYNESKNALTAPELDQLYNTILKTMLLDPDRGDPLEGLKSEPAWKMTETISKSWLNLPSTMIICKAIEGEFQTFGSLVDQIIEHRKKLQYRAARTIVRSGQLSSAYLALTSKLSSCGQSLEEETVLLKETQRRYRFQQLSLAIDDFFTKYSEVYPEDKIFTQSLPSGITRNSEASSSQIPGPFSSPIKIKPPVEVINTIESNIAKTDGKMSESLIIVKVLLASNLLILIALVIFFRHLVRNRNSHDQNKPTESETFGIRESAELDCEQTGDCSTKASHEVPSSTFNSNREAEMRSLAKMRVDFQRIVDSDSFFHHLAEELKSVENRNKEDYLKYLTAYIERINDIISEKEDLESTQRSLENTLSEIKDRPDHHHYSALEGLISVLSQSEQYSPHAA